MNEQRMGMIVLILLGLLNLFLFGYYCYQRMSSNLVPTERIEQIKTLYRESGIDFAIEPDRNNRPMAYLKLEEADLDEMVERFLDSGFDKSYIYGSKVQYTSGTVTVTTDWKQHQIVYTDESEAIVQGQLQTDNEQRDWQEEQKLSEEEEERMLLTVARSFAQKWLGEEVYLLKGCQEKGGFDFIFCQMQDEELLYFNQIEIYVLPEGIAGASLTCWQVVGETEKTYELSPIDEILYAQLGKLTEELTEGERDEVIAIMTGYQLKEPTEEMLAVPSVSIVLKSGKKYHMKRAG